MRVLPTINPVGTLDPLIEDFLERDVNREWLIYSKRRQVYVRHGRRLSPDAPRSRYRSLDLAAFSTPTDNFDNAVFIYNWTTAAEATCDNRGMLFYVENLLNPRLAAFYERRKGYIRDKFNGIPSYYRLPQ